MAEQRKPAQKHYVDDSQSPYNEAQHTPANSGDPRTSNSAVNVDLPYGVPTDDLHPITQPQGDVTDPASAPVNAPSGKVRHTGSRSKASKGKKAA